jgi:hypothetical protein
MTKDILTQYIGYQLPQGITLSSQQIDQVVTAVLPVVKTTLTGAAASFADYLTGGNTPLNIKLDLTSALPTLKTVVKQAFTAQLPANLRGASPTVINNAFEQYYADFVKTIPTTYQIDSTNLDWSSGATGQIDTMITDAQNNLAEARSNIDSASRDFADKLNQAKTYVGYFRLGFTGLIALIILLILGIALIYRSVKGACLNLGILFTVYGAGALAVVLVTKFIAERQIGKLDIPQSLSNLPGTILNDVLSPLKLVSLVCLIGGVILIVVSIVYPKLRPAKTEPPVSPSAS